MEFIIHEFILLWAVIDPIGTVPVFLAVTASMDASLSRKTAFKAVFIAAMVLIFFVVAGQILMESMGIPLSAFEIAGGIVLFIFALTMIFGESKPEEEMHLIERGAATAVFPLAIPSIASPGAMMAVVMLTDNHRHSIAEQFITSMVVMAVLAVTLVLLLLAGPIKRVIGDAGASIISRVMGLVLASVAVNAVLSGISTHFGLIVM